MDIIAVILVSVRCHGAELIDAVLAVGRIEVPGCRSALSLKELFPGLAFVCGNLAANGCDLVLILCADRDLNFTGNALTAQRSEQRDLRCGLIGSRHNRSRLALCALLTEAIRTGHGIGVLLACRQIAVRIGKRITRSDIGNLFPCLAVILKTVHTVSDGCCLGCQRPCQHGCPTAGLCLQLNLLQRVVQHTDGCVRLIGGAVDVGYGHGDRVVAVRHLADIPVIADRSEILAVQLDGVARHIALRILEVQLHGSHRGSLGELDRQVTVHIGDRIGREIGTGDLHCGSVDIQRLRLKRFSAAGSYRGNGIFIIRIRGQLGIKIRGFLGFRDHLDIAVDAVAGNRLIGKGHVPLQGNRLAANARCLQGDRLIERLNGHHRGRLDRRINIIVGGEDVCAFHLHVELAVEFLIGRKGQDSDVAAVERILLMKAGQLNGSAAGNILTVTRDEVHLLQLQRSIKSDGEIVRCDVLCPVHEGKCDLDVIAGEAACTCQLQRDIFLQIITGLDRQLRGSTRKILRQCIAVTNINEAVLRNVVRFQTFLGENRFHVLTEQLGQCGKVIVVSFPVAVDIAAAGRFDFSSESSLGCLQRQGTQQHKRCRAAGEQPVSQLFHSNSFSRLCVLCVQMPDSTVITVRIYTLSLSLSHFLMIVNIKNCDFTAKYLSNIAFYL